MLRSVSGAPGAPVCRTSRRPAASVTSTVSATLSTAVTATSRPSPSARPSIASFHASTSPFQPT
jgi:hypothetical protein